MQVRRVRRDRDAQALNGAVARIAFVGKGQQSSHVGG